MKKLNLRLLRLMKNSKGQVIAVTTVIVVGLLVYTALNMAALNMESTVNYYYEDTNFAHIYAKLVKMPAKAIKDFQNKYGIKLIEGRIVSDVPLKVEDKDEKVTVRIISAPKSKGGINSLVFNEGNPISDINNDVLVIKQFAEARNIKVGDIINPQIGGRVYNLTVKGIVSSPEFIYLMENEQTLLPQPDKFGVLYVSHEFARQSLGFKDSYNEVIIKLNDGIDEDKVKDKLEEELDKYGVKRIITREDQLSNRMLWEEITQLKKSSSSVPILFLVVASIILGVMISRMVKNDRTSIGVLKALGYNNLQIIAHYTKYSLVIGSVGAIIGTIGGMVLSGSMTKLYIQFFNIPMLKVNFYFRYILMAVLLSSIFCIAAGLFGGRKVLKILPAESMRPEPPKTGKRIFLEKIKIIWNRMSFSWKIVIRNIFRSKKRSAFIALGIALTFSISFVTFHLEEASYDIFAGHYGEFQQMDYNINFSKPLNKNVIKDIKNLIEADNIEGKIEYPFEISYGWKSKVVNIIGVYRNTKFYNFKNLKDESINLPKKGIVLSENLAKYLGVGKGDIISINTFIPGRDDINIEVREVIKQNLGINGYMNIDEMADKLLDKELITGVYVDTEYEVKDKLNNVKNISSVQSTQDLIDIFMEFMELTIYSIGIMLIFAGVLGFAIVYNSTIMGISERTLEFSSLRVMGFSKQEIYRIILKENFIMTILGIILGLPIGRVMVRSIEEAFSNDLYTFHTPISLKSYLFAALATIAFVILAQLSTLRKVYKLDFMEALKSRIS